MLYRYQSAGNIFYYLILHIDFFRGCPISLIMQAIIFKITRHTHIHTHFQVLFSNSVHQIGKSSQEK